MRGRSVQRGAEEHGPRRARPIRSLRAVTGERELGIRERVSSPSPHPLLWGKEEKRKRGKPTDQINNEGKSVEQVEWSPPRAGASARLGASGDEDSSHLPRPRGEDPVWAPGAGDTGLFCKGQFFQDGKKGLAVSWGFLLSFSGRSWAGS